MKQNKKSIAALALGLALFAGGVAMSVAAVWAHVGALSAINEFRNSLYVRSDAEYVSNYDAYPVIVSGELTYDGDAYDPIFGVSVDAPLLARVSEMYQWLPRGDGFEAGWSEEIVDTGDAGHSNPTSYPAGTESGAYSAPSAMLGEFYVRDWQLSMLPTHEKLSELPSVDTKGFFTAGDYITNSTDPDSPKIGDVRIRYEYVSAGEITLTGMQLNGGVKNWKSENGHVFELAFEGKLTWEEVIDGYRDEFEKIVWWLFIPGIVVTIGGAALAMNGFAGVSGYNATMTVTLGKKKHSCSGARAASAYGAVFGALVLAVTLSSMRVTVGAIWLLVSIVLAVVFLYAFIMNVAHNTPKRVKPEKPYEPILRKKD